MPPRPAAPTPHPTPDWSVLLLERARNPKANAQQSARRRHGPATLAEAIHRFVDRNWD